MDVGSKRVKTDASRLVTGAHDEKAIVELVAINESDQAREQNRRFEIFKHKAPLPADWDSQESRRKASRDVMKLMGID